MANSKQKGKAFTVAVAVIALALGFLLVAALMRGYGSLGGANPGGAADPARSASQGQEAASATEPAARPTPAPTRDASPLSNILGDSRTPPQPRQGEASDWLMTFA